MTKRLLVVVVLCVGGTGTCLGDLPPGGPWIMDDVLFDPEEPPQRVGDVEVSSDPDPEPYPTWERPYANPWVNGAWPEPAAASELEYGQCDIFCTTWGWARIVMPYSMAQYTSRRAPVPPDEETYRFWYSARLWGHLDCFGPQAYARFGDFWWKITRTRPNQPKLNIGSWHMDQEDPAKYVQSGQGFKWVDDSWDQVEFSDLQEGDTIKIHVRADSTYASTSEGVLARAYLGWFEALTEINSED